MRLAAGMAVVVPAMRVGGQKEKPNGDEKGFGRILGFLRLPLLDSQAFLK